MPEPSPLSTPSGQQREHHWRRKRRLRAVQVSQQPITTTTARTAQKMRCIKPSSKLWWEKAKEIMKHEAQVRSIPALKSNDGEWVLDAQGKANLFAVTLAEECKLPRLCHNTYTVCTQCHELSVWPPWTIAPLVLTFCLLASSKVARNSWPNLFSPCYNACWRPSPGLSLGANIGLSPIYKKKAVFAASNYRGIHLTAQLSKVVERLLLPLIEPHISRTVAFGPNQFAYTKCRGARDALAYLTMPWLLALNRRKKVAVYCSDVCFGCVRQSSS